MHFIRKTKLNIMKKIYILALGLIGITSTSFGQNGLKPQSDVELNLIEMQTTIANDVVSQRAVQFCTDTNRWAWGRSITSGAATYYATFLHKEASVPNSYGTYVNVPAGTDVTVSGFGLFARSIRPDGASVSVTATLYAAGTDSLPMGTALRTASLTLDTTTSNSLSLWQQKAIFATPATVTGSFVITIENSTTVGDSIHIIRGFTGSGVADGYPVVYQADGIASGDYFRNAGGTFGARLPHFYPYVTFKQTSSYVMSVSQLSGPNEDVDFTYSAYSLKNHPIWSIDGFINQPTTYYSVDGGSTFSVSSTGDTTITFVDQYTDYNIVMNDSITMWSNGTCVISEAGTLLGKPNGIEDHQANELKAYFANSELNIINGSGNATLYDITGRMVKQFQLNNQFETIDVSDLNEGVYILQVGDSVTKLKL